MAELFHCQALVIRESDYGENDKLLTLLTPEKGKISVIVKGAKSLKNKNSASSQLLCYSEFTLKERGGFHMLSEASLIEQFFDLRSDISRFALGQYVAEVCLEISVENESGDEMLSLALNTLYMLCKGDRSPDHIKAVFELRCAVINGYCPNLDNCPICLKSDHGVFYLDIMNGTLRCGDCFGSDEDIKTRQGITSVIIPLTPSVLEGMRYIVNSHPKRIFSFNVPENEQEDLYRACEKYLLNQLERGFKTLDFYKKIKELG